MGLSARYHRTTFRSLPKCRYKPLLSRYDAFSEQRLPAMRRREFITILGVALATVPGATSAQSGRMAAGTMLLSQSKDSQEGKHHVAAVREGLKKLGWTEGRNIRIDARYTNGNAHRMRARRDAHLGGEFA
jgi:hypothetical protein